MPNRFLAQQNRRSPEIDNARCRQAAPKTMLQRKVFRTTSCGGMGRERHEGHRLDRAGGCRASDRAGGAPGRHVGFKGGAPSAKCVNGPKPPPSRDRRSAIFPSTLLATAAPLTPAPLCPPSAVPAPAFRTASVPISRSRHDPARSPARGRPARGPARPSRIMTGQATARRPAPMGRFA